MELGIQQEVEHNAQGKNTKYIKYFVIGIYSTAWKKRWASHVEKMPRASGGAFKI
jgi:hypothetical protein